MNSLSTPEFEPELIYGATNEILATRYDINPLLKNVLGENWQDQFEHVTSTLGRLIVRDASHSTCREADPSSLFGLTIVGGRSVVECIPGVSRLYEGLFQDLMRVALPSGYPPMKTWQDPDRWLELYRHADPETDSKIQQRMEAHVDQRYTAILVIRSEVALGSGRLVIAHNSTAQNVDEINEEATYVEHTSGTLICFPKGTVYPHYSEEINEGEQRVIGSINYPLASETLEQADSIVAYNNGASNKSDTAIVSGI